MIKAKLLEIWEIKQNSNKIEQNLKEFKWALENLKEKLNAVLKVRTKHLNNNLFKFFKKFEWKL